MDQKEQPIKEQDLKSPIWNEITEVYGYHIHKFLGKGSYGSVVKATSHSSKKACAIKLINDPFKNQYSARMVLREVQILRKLKTLKNNVFTTKIIDILLPIQAYDQTTVTQSGVESDEQTPENQEINLNCLTHIFIVMEYVESDVKKLLERKPRVAVNEDHLVTILYNSLCAM